jgi:multicomponent K+:H+ antiporter subunit A
MPLLIALSLPLTGALLALAYGLAPAAQRRLSLTGLAWLLSLAPFSAFGLLLASHPQTQALTFSLNWLPSLGLSLGLYYDSLSALFALLVSGIGGLVVVYAGYYFKDDSSAARFLTYLLLFMTSMLGLVLAGDLITLFIFWEGTSVVSFLLVAYKYKDEAARRGAFKALLITGGGGIALLGGFVLLSTIAGSADLAVILKSGGALRSSPLYPAMLALVAVGAFTKSAQTPFHIWLPDAMSAPTPASAYLHSATMVKAGIYLMARLNPALGNTDLWFYLLSGFGCLTMLAGAYLGLKQNDLKALLAYSTVSQLGVLMMLIGQDTEIAFKALVIGVLAHALYKCALFLVAGIVDHETGARDLRRLGGLARAMPCTLAVGGVAALSMAGLPPLFGFLAKETLLATVTHPNVPLIVDNILTAAAVIAGAFILAQAAMLIYDTFLGKPRAELRPHEAPWGMLLPPAIPAMLSLAVGLLPEPVPLASFLAGAAANAYGDKVKVSLALWTGINVPLVLSVIAISLGAGLFAARGRIRPIQDRLGARSPFNALFSGLLWLVDRGAYLATRVQAGRLRLYLAVMLLSMGGLLAAFGWPAFPALPALTFEFTFAEELILLRAFTVVLAALAAAVTVFLRRDFFAILALGASGLSVALFIALEPSPDVALVQVVVDILTTVILTLALSRIPREQRQRAGEFTFRQSWPGLARDALIGVGAGVLMTAIVLTALTSRPRSSVVTPYYAENAKPLTGANDIVGAIVVDFRGFDTLIEISVFGMAGIGVYSLLRYASRKHGDEAAAAPAPGPGLPTFGIGGGRTSAFMRLMAHAILPLALMIAATHVIYGHDQPGDGFTAGVIASLGVGFWYVVFGYHETKRRLPWLRPAPLIASGILLAVAGSTLPALAGGAFFAPVDIGAAFGLPLPKGFYLSTSFLFEAAICLAVLGSASFTLDTLGRPRDADAESEADLQTLAAAEKRAHQENPELSNAGREA